MAADGKGPSKNNVYILDADASRRAALLVTCIRPVCALLAPCRAGASTPRMQTLFFDGLLSCRLLRRAADDLFRLDDGRDAGGGHDSGERRGGRRRKPERSSDRMYAWPPVSRRPSRSAARPPGR